MTRCRIAPISVRFLALSLALCLLTLSGLVFPQAVMHAGHHAHHQAATHASALCTWMCAAGQGLESVVLLITESISPVTTLDGTVPDSIDGIVPTPSQSRGPPLLS
jgi:hypothetical protein